MNSYIGNSSVTSADAIDLRSRNRVLQNGYGWWCYQILL